MQQVQWEQYLTEWTNEWMSFHGTHTPLYFSTWVFKGPMKWSLKKRLLVSPNCATKHHHLLCWSLFHNTVWEICGLHQKSLRGSLWRTWRAIIFLPVMLTNRFSLSYTKVVCFLAMFRRNQKPSNSPTWRMKWAKTQSTLSEGARYCSSGVVLMELKG